MVGACLCLCSTWSQVGGVTLMRWTDAQALYASYKKFRFKVAKFKYYMGKYAFLPIFGSVAKTEGNIGFTFNPRAGNPRAGR